MPSRDLLLADCRPWKWRSCESAAGLVYVDPHSGLLCASLGSGDHRAEVKLDTAASNPAGVSSRAVYRWRTYLPADYPRDDRWQILAQWHDIWDPPPEHAARYPAGMYFQAPPPLSLSLFSEQLVLQAAMILRRPAEVVADPRTGRLAYARVPLRKSRVELGAMPFGRWVSVEMLVDWSTDDDGGLKVLIDGRQAGNHDGPNLYNNRGNHFKIGLYRHVDITSAARVYHAEIEVEARWFDLAEGLPAPRTDCPPYPGQ